MRFPAIASDCEMGHMSHVAYYWLIEIIYLRCPGSGDWRMRKPWTKRGESFYCGLSVGCAPAPCLILRTAHAQTAHLARAGPRGGQPTVILAPPKWGLSLASQDIPALWLVNIPSPLQIADDQKKESRDRVASAWTDLPVVETIFIPKLWNTFTENDFRKDYLLQWFFWRPSAHWISSYSRFQTLWRGLKFEVIMVENVSPIPTTLLCAHIENIDFIPETSSLTQF